jgi:hypothetical protein
VQYAVEMGMRRTAVIALLAAPPEDALEAGVDDDLVRVLFRPPEARVRLQAVEPGIGHGRYFLDEDEEAEAGKFGARRRWP